MKPPAKGLAEERVLQRSNTKSKAERYRMHLKEFSDLGKHLSTSRGLPKSLLFVQEVLGIIRSTGPILALICNTGSNLILFSQKRVW